MFGYKEHHHTVISSQTIVRGGHDAQLDVRRPQLSPHLMHLLEGPTVNPDRRQQMQREMETYCAMPDYLVLTIQGKPIYMEYAPAFSRGSKNGNREESMRRLHEDLERLVVEPNIDLKTLQWSEIIHNDTGYKNDGSVTMY